MVACGPNLPAKNSCLAPCHLQIHRNTSQGNSSFGPQTSIFELTLAPNGLPGKIIENPSLQYVTCLSFNSNLFVTQCQ